ncbi:MAG: glycoside hydrolase family 15 protein [Candidatus Melainabacteria bacterium]|nr:glycoside hydrolase family 15 protein [Candidatus Melainabacteria bacterium]
MSTTHDSDKTPAAALNYGLIGNGRIAALVSHVGSLDYLCMPAFDSPFVFDRLLDSAHGGHFLIEPLPLEAYRVTQQYEKNSNVLVTTYQSEFASFALHDFCPRWEIWDGNQSHTPAELYRYIEILSGEPEVRVHFHPKSGYSEALSPCLILNESTLSCAHGEQSLFLVSNSPPEEIIGQSTLRLKADTFFALSYEQPVHDASVASVKEKLVRTNQYWQRWIKNCYLPDEYQSTIIRSALTLKQLIYEPTGAIIAAPTTSLPEIVGGRRNWDYRYCWIRDSFFTVNALLKLSKFEETENYIAYLTKIILENPNYLKPLYTIEGREVPRVSTLDYLAGFENSTPVRIGNDATFHHQTDAYGEAVLSIYPVFMDERVIRKDFDLLWRCIERLVALAVEKFPEKDNGLWEFGDRCEHHTFSKLLCWVAVDRGCNIAYRLKKVSAYRKWGRQRKAMRDEILREAWNPSLQAFTQAYGGNELDASTLLMPVLGFIDPKDPRMLATIQRSEAQLMFDGLMFRYTNDDELGKPENAFTICTFWLIDALALSGQKRKARQYFEQLLAYGNPLGLFSEDINQRTRELTGNFPQGYTHVAIINSAMLLADR